MVGLILKFNNWSKNIFKELFKNIDINNFVFKLNYWESYGSFNTNYDFNDLSKINSNIIKNELFLKNSEIYPEFAELLISKNVEGIDCVNTYSDFINSNYFISIVIIDHRNIEICCKNQQILEKIIENFKISKLENKKINILNSIMPNAIIHAFRTKNDTSIYD